jgi:hypothetical protein
MTRHCAVGAALLTTAVMGCGQEQMRGTGAGQAAGSANGAGPAAVMTQADAAAADSVIAVVQRFFDVMAAQDVEGGRAVLIDEGRFFAVRQDGSMRTFTNAEFLADLPAEDGLHERMWDPEVRVHGPIATVWTPYDFHIGGEFSHCGVDAFNLVRTADGWKIAGGVYTVEPSGCAASPLGPLEQD